MHTYSGNQLDRAALRRLDQEWLKERWDREDTCFIQFAGERPLVQISADAGSLAVRWPRKFCKRAALDNAILLGVDADDRAIFGLDVGVTEDGEPKCDVADDTKLIDLRSLAAQGILSGPDLSMLAQARSMLLWHETHSFCARCGAPSTISEAGYKRHCAACGREHFPRTDPVVIIVVRDGDYCLLGRSAHFAEGSYSALAGFVEPGETIEEAAQREVFEESGIKTTDIHYHSSQPWPFPSSLMIGLIGDAANRDITIDYNELQDARWFARDEVATMLEGTHPEGLYTPPPFAIAHHLVRTFVLENG